MSLVISLVKQVVRLLWWHHNMANTFDLEFGGADAVAEATGTTSRGFTAGITPAEATTNTPPKASAAPVAGKQNIFTGLCEALNSYQKEQVRLKRREIPDQYVIEFAPANIGSSSVKREGPQDITTAPMQTPDSAAKISPAENSVNKNARTWPVAAGTQIIKVIDDVMRNSSYITEQQNVEISTTTDPITGIQTQKVNAKSGSGDMRWYKISVATRQLGYDKIIRDHAYQMRFIITPYPVAQMTSQYFPDSRFRGVHKAYQYWFTGANSQILNYEQQYNNAYRLVLSGIGPNQQKQVTTDFRDQNRYITMATSTNQALGAKAYANEPGNNAASFLYDPVSLSQVKMRIIGDPGWMQQGECGLGVSAKNFNFSPFNADGSINYDSQAVMFSVAFNTPADYDFNTGLVNVNEKTRNGQPQEYYTFQAVKCKNYFSKGRFEQEIEGKLVIEKNTKPNVSTPIAGNGRPANGALSGTGAGSRNSNILDDGSRGYAIQDETGKVSPYRKNEYGDLYVPLEDAAQNPDSELTSAITPQPAAEPEPPTSPGDIDYAAGLAGTDPGATSEAPQLIAQDDA
jgi:hypothetical protein